MIDPSLRKRYFSQGQCFEILMGVLSAIRDVQTSHLLVKKIKQCGTERKWCSEIFCWFSVFVVCRSGGGRRQWRISGLFRKSFSQDHPAVNAHTRSDALPPCTLHLHSCLPPPPPLLLLLFPPLAPRILSLPPLTHSFVFRFYPYRQFLFSQPAITSIFESGSYLFFKDTYIFIFGLNFIRMKSVMINSIFSIWEYLHGSFRVEISVKQTSIYLFLALCGMSGFCWQGWWCFKCPCGLFHDVKILPTLHDMKSITVLWSTNNILKLTFYFKDKNLSVKKSYFWGEGFKFGLIW